MGILLIKCPLSGRPISTGIEIEADSLLNLPDVLSHVKCPECRLEHAWWAREAWLEESGEMCPPDKEAA